MTAAALVLDVVAVRRVVDGFPARVRGVLYLPIWLIVDSRVGFSGSNP